MNIQDKNTNNNTTSITSSIFAQIGEMPSWVDHQQYNECISHIVSKMMTSQNVKKVLVNKFKGGNESDWNIFPLMDLIDPETNRLNLNALKALNSDPETQFKLEELYYNDSLHKATVKVIGLFVRLYHSYVVKKPDHLTMRGYVEQTAFESEDAKALIPAFVLTGMIMSVLNASNRGDNITTLSSTEETVGKAIDKLDFLSRKLSRSYEMRYKNTSFIPPSSFDDIEDVDKQKSEDATALPPTDRNVVEDIYLVVFKIMRGEDLSEDEARRFSFNNLAMLFDHDLIGIGERIAKLVGQDGRPKDEDVIDLAAFLVSDLSKVALEYRKDLNEQQELFLSSIDPNIYFDYKSIKRTMSLFL